MLNITQFDFSLFSDAALLVLIGSNLSTALHSEWQRVQTETGA